MKRSSVQVRGDPYLQEVKGSLTLLMYRYVVTRIPGSEEEADRKTRLLLSLVEDVHDCAEMIFGPGEEGTCKQSRSIT